MSKNKETDGDKVIQIPQSEGHEFLKTQMESRGISRAELAKGLGLDWSKVNRAWNGAKTPVIECLESLGYKVTVMLKIEKP